MKKISQKIELKKIAAFFIFSISLLLTIDSHAQIITTITGNGTGGYNGDGAQATATEMNQPSSVALDGNGNIFIADVQSNRIRRVDASTGIVTTVAGNGTRGYTGDGSQATVAELDQPWSLYLDATGNIYVADWGNSAIRKVTISSGVITTIAGNGTAGYNSDGIQATAAKLNHPGGVYVDNLDNIFIADVDNQRVRKINTLGVISTIAGTGISGYNGDGIQATAAKLDNPSTVALDGSGNVYIADYYNNEIRKVTVSTGIITSIAGNGTAGYSGDGTQATAAEIHNPAGVMLDAGGNVYIADYTNNAIRKVEVSTGIITTVAGTGTAGYSGDGGMATAAEINKPWDIAITPNAFYIAENMGNRVRKVTISTTGMEQISNGITATVYPNPVIGNLTVQIEGANGKVDMILFNMLGQQVLQEYSNEKNTNISVANLSPGIYILKIATLDGNMLTQKICITR
jgi:sugar lactone lactonase YvrE